MVSWIGSVRRAVALGLAAVLVVGFVSVASPAPAAADAPNVVSANGITVHGWRWITARTLEVDISTASVGASPVAGPHRVRITLPNELLPGTARRASRSSTSARRCRRQLGAVDDRRRGGRADHATAGR